MDKTTLTRDVVRALKQVYDPEIPVNIYDLGLIYDMTIDDDHKVHISRGRAHGCGRYAGSYGRGYRDNIRPALGQVPDERRGFT